MKILIVDDSTSMRRMIQVYLKKIGLGNEEIVEAEDGEDGLNVLQKNPDVDIILTDNNMPELMGTDMILKIREIKEFAELPIIMITTDGKDEERLYALKVGANEYITKPFTQMQLKKKIEKVLEI